MFSNIFLHFRVLLGVCMETFVTPVLASVDNDEDTSQTDCPCSFILNVREREREMFYLTMHSTHFIYGYMASEIWLRTILKPAAAT